MQPDAASRLQVAVWPTRVGPTPSSHRPSIAASAEHGGERSGWTLRTTALGTQQGSDAAEATPQQLRTNRSRGRARRKVLDPRPVQGRCERMAFETNRTRGAAHHA